ncbi:MAG: hypothetical protein A2672_02220 [Candidatus Wildermuthbacteria bacterium RIFCSPHIGHO2_01_FULL_49_22b]|uniref:Uncharacterized protein n=1 Tax=Candidatus Wildermuthbacteria bacterium RIFCSPHIGHO2_01_FULL_49_22b TaxID=1802448 RepID=A0A1G2QYP6_9BACT|nr:MAG: hypothetical protein A2672_02220 [Candidatus Wildermuthbacteria bacterium RIFCSPHIGHO2_01_FULL_49_22b]
MELAPDVQKLAAEYKRWYEATQPKKGIATIGVDEVAAKVASFYEKIRGVVDWREEHLLRKTAIERILKRRMLLGTKEDFAEPFLQELIRGGHFPNERIPTTKIQEIQKIVEKYFYLLEHSPREGTEKVLAELKMWLLGIAACEIEETLAPPIRERALFEFMAQDMQKRVQLPEEASMREKEKSLQISVAVQRALFKLDEATITYHLLEEKYQDWENPGEQTLQQLAPQLPQLKNELSAVLRHPLAERFYQTIERYDSPYLILGDIMSTHPAEFEQFSSDRAAVEAGTKESYKNRRGKLAGKMRRAAVYSTLSVFLSKVLIAFAVEIPVDKYLTGDFNQTALWLSIAVPPLLMLLLVLSIKTTTEDNFQRVVMEVMKITYGKRNGETLEISLPRRKRPMLEAFINAIYLLSFLVSFGAISWVLWQLQFSVLSIIVFLFFVSLVAFAGTKIRQRGRELLLGKESQGFLYTVFDLFSLPVIQTGRWLSRQVAKYNILVVIFNFLIEIPFQMFVEFLEQWRSFLQEKREEVH